MFFFVFMVKDLEAKKCFLNFYVFANYISYFIVNYAVWFEKSHNHLFSLIILKRCVVFVDNLIMNFADNFDNANCCCIHGSFH